MKTLSLVTLAFGLGLALPRTAPFPQAAGVAPPLRFHLELEGRDVPVQLDASFLIPASDTPRAARLRMDPQRLFQLPGLEFEYPAELAFSADLSDPDFDHWSLEGPSTSILVQRYGDVESLEALLAEVVTALGEYYEDQGEIVGTTIELGPRELAGYQLRIDHLGSAIVQSVFTFRTGDTNYALMVADYRDSLEDSVGEGRQAVETLLKQTFRFLP